MTLFSYAEGILPLSVGMDQTGYIARHGGSVGILDHPKIKAVRLQQVPDRPIVLVFCDLLGFSPEQSRLYEAHIARRVGTLAQRVFLTCTHTHAAPAAMSLLLLGECRDSWFSEFERTLDAVLEELVCQTAMPVEISFGKTAVTGVARNRVTHYESDVDTDATLLLFETKQQRVALVNYACHPVTLNADNRLYSADYPGRVCQTLKAQGALSAVIFTTAPCGDLNPILQDEPGRHDRLEEYGDRIAMALVPLLSPDRRETLVGVDCEKRTVELALFCEHDRAEHRALAARAREKHAQTTDDVERKYQEANFLYALTHERLAELGMSERSFTATVSRISFGPFTLVGVPFELFSDVGIRLKERLAPACVMELCGGNFGYFPSEARWEMASYERADAYLYYNRGGPLTRDAQHRLEEVLCK